MAKQTSLIRVQGTVGDVTYVSSNTYGNHTRAKRGTHKPAPVNASLEREGKMMVMANLPAKIFKDAIDPYRKYRRGTLWQRLVSIFQKQLKKDNKFDFAKLRGFDILETYPMSRFLALTSAVTIDKSRLQIEINYDAHPTFKKVKETDGYMLTVIGIFPDLKKKTATTTDVSSAVRKLSGPVTPLVLQLDIPPKAKEYVICLKLQGCIKGVVSYAVTTTSLSVINAGAI